MTSSDSTARDIGTSVFTFPLLVVLIMESQSGNEAVLLYRFRACMTVCMTTGSGRRSNGDVFFVEDKKDDD